jgi:phospholipase/carboxylesterase
VPAAPLVEVGGGRAWWHLDPEDRPVHAYDERLRDGHRAHPQVRAAREAVQALLRTIVRRHAPDALVLAGFSQGAMLALDVALASAPPIARVAALSGVLLVDSLAALMAPGPRPEVLLAHGRDDELLPLRGSERARVLLERHGCPVTWRPFDGGHEIPDEVIEELRGFLLAGAA